MRLNLGCGPVYRPGFVNIDKYENSVADSLADAARLGYENESVDTIEATQLIEHFDVIHCRYLLAEWFRVLRPGGILGMETPDLAKSFKKLLAVKGGGKESVLRWVYGIDSPGLQHKSGYTFDMIHALLAETGFADIRRKPPTTHTYEPGMRIECRKPDDSGNAQFLALLRRSLVRRMNLSDSFVMIPLESWIQRIRSEIGDPVSLDKNRLHRVITISAPCNPKVPLSVLDALQGQGVFAESQLNLENEAMNRLVNLRFHERGFSLWVKSRKEGRMDEEFGRFLEMLSKTVTEILEDPNRGDAALQYISTIEPRSIEILDPVLVIQKSKTLLSKGIRMFHLGDASGAEEAFLESVKMNPENLLAHWNLARISIVLSRGDDRVHREYELASRLAQERPIRARILKESGSYGKAIQTTAPMSPICEADLL